MTSLTKTEKKDCDLKAKKITKVITIVVSRLFRLFLSIGFMSYFLINMYVTGVFIRDNIPKDNLVYIFAPFIGTGVFTLAFITALYIAGVRFKKIYRENGTYTYKIYTK